MDCRFQKPVYDGNTATASGSLVGDTIELKVESKGELCATGRACLPHEATHAPAISQFATSTPPPLEARPPAAPESLPVGKVLCIQPFVLTEELWRTYLIDVRERHPLYSDERLAHPGQLLRLCNLVLRENVVLPPWVHVGSKVENFSAARVGDELGARGRVIANYERKGHKLVDLDVALIANGDRLLARVTHTAIYALRHLQAA